MAKNRPLTSYSKKRNFSKTPEPLARAAKAGNLYVIQRHDATRLHYDLRLQHNGVLLSWAVPKEPTMDSGVKRLAVRVEDHPVEYGSFEGTIPEGNYGAGSVEIWDKGTWEPHEDVDKALNDGNLKFRISGERLQGEFDLVRMGEPSEKENWLLIKRKESPSQSNHSTGFMLCQSEEKPPKSQGWICEVKWDGYRVFARREGKEIKITTRGGNALELPHIENKLLKLIPNKAWLDGELVVIDTDGRTSFRRLQQALPECDDSIQLIVFDILHDGSKDLKAEPIESRRQVLEELLEHSAGTIRLSTIIPGTPSDAFAACCQLGYEGVICKKVGSSYKAGRYRDWLKVKCIKDHQMIVIGYTGHSSDDQAIGALVLADKSQTGVFRYAGRVGTGFTQQERRDLKTKLEKLKVKESPIIFPDSQSKRGVFYVKPVLEVHVKYLEQSLDGVLRQAKYEGSAEPSMKQPPQTPTFTVTHGDRIIDNLSKTTKQQIANYYAGVIELIFPYLEGRATSIIRCPEGADHDCFFQRNPPNHEIEGAGQVEVDGHTYITIDKPEAILNYVQYGAIEFHPSGAKASDPNHPDTVVFDLDPGEGVEFAQIIEQAFNLRDLLENLGIPSFPRTTGGKGIHVVLPTQPDLTWTKIKAFSKTFSEECCKSHDILICDSSKDLRKGKIYLDYLRNSQHATAVASYSLRARPGIPLAMPLRWADLKHIKSANQFSLGNVGDLPNANPWENWRSQEVSLKRLLKL